MRKTFPLVVFGRRRFCSVACLDAALVGDTLTGRRIVRCPDYLAKVITCECCGLFIDEEAK